MRPHPYRGDYINGRFSKVKPAEATGELSSHNPAQISDQVYTGPFAVSRVDKAVEAAQRAQRAWAELPFAKRAGYLKKIAAQLSNRKEDLAALITRELGKPLWEARGEAAACAAKVGITLEEGLALTREHRPEGVAGRYLFKPHGVLSVIGPFNFPAHLINGHVIPALATGNTVVIKPSEVTPAVGQLYAEILDEADLPKGVVNVVQGDGRVGAALSAHPGVDGVLFTGSYDVGRRIQAATLDQPWKILALEMGGKNPAIVLDDAPLEKAVHDVLWAAYVSAGQRCSATSWAIVHRKVVDAFTERLVAQAQRVSIGDPTAPGTFMGPLATEAAREKYLAGARAGEAEGAEALLSPQAHPELTQGYFVQPGIHRVRTIVEGSAYQTQELFGPDVAIYEVHDLDEAVAMANSLDYGLSASVFTQDPRRFEQALGRLDFGCINHNAPTCGASSKLPFGGLKKSGNHRPAGLFSSLYCAAPVASLEGPSEVNLEAISPGFGWGGEG